MKTDPPTPQQAADGPSATLSLTLPNTLQACETARQQVEAFLAPHRPTVKALFHIELVLEEVLTNQHKYAYDDDALATGQRQTWLQASVQGEQVTLVFEDEGVAFNPLEVAVPVLPSSLQSARPGKLGIFLVRRYAKTVVYERAGARSRLEHATS